MSGYCKYYKQKKQVSYDNGATWQDVVPAEYQKGSLYETDSTDCGYIASFERWIESGTTCDGENLYKLMVYQTSSDGINWVTTEQTKLGDLIEASSSQCSSGYRWVETDSYGCREESMPLGNYKICGYRYKTEDASSGLEWFEIPCDYQRVTDCGGATSELLTGVDTAQLPQGNNAYSARNIQTAYIGDCVDEIGYDVVGRWSYVVGKGCKHEGGFNYNLETVIMSDSVESITSSYYSGAFESCENLKIVRLSNNLKYLGEASFSGCKSLSSITIPDSVISIGQGAFYSCENLTTVNVPSGLTTCGMNVFYNCHNLSNVTIGNGAQLIGMNMFSGCKSLSSITIPDSVISIGSFAFDGCIRLSDITVGSGVTTIEDAAFQKCSDLKTIILPSSLKNMGNNVFNDCNSLKQIFINAAVPPTPISSDYRSFIGYTGNLEAIYVPASSVNTYKTDFYWSEYADIIYGIN